MSGEEELSASTPTGGWLAGELEELDGFAEEFARLGHETLGGGLASNEGTAIPGRINVDAASVEQGLGKLVLSLVELLRRLLEKQALKRMDAGLLADDQIERIGETFLKFDEQMVAIKAALGLADEDLNLNLGPLGRLLPDERPDEGESARGGHARGQMGLAPEQGRT